MSIFYFRLACDQTRRTRQAYARPKRRGILFPLPYATPETLAEWQPQWLGSKVFQCHTLCSGSNNGRDLPILDLLKRKEDLGSIENLHEGSTAGRDRTAEQGQSQRICVIFFSSISIVQWAKGSADFKVNCLSHYHIGTQVTCFLNVKPVIFRLEDVLA